MKKQNTKIDATTELIFEVFRLNGALVEAGNKLVEPIGLSSAGWQVLGVLASNPEKMTVPQIAKNMKLSRQAVQKTVNKLIVSDLVMLADNPFHKRAKLIVVTEKGSKIFDAAIKRYQPWAEKLMQHISANNIKKTTETAEQIREQLETMSEID